MQYDDALGGAGLYIFPLSSLPRGTGTNLLGRFDAGALFAEFDDSKQDSLRKCASETIATPTILKCRSAVQTCSHEFTVSACCVLQ